MLIQYIAIAILLALIGFAFRDVKHAILIWLPFKLLFNNQIAIRYAAPGMSLLVAGDLALLAVYLLKRKEADLYNGNFLFQGGFKAFLISYIISIMFTIAPIQTVIISTIKFFSCSFCMVYLAHKALNKLEDIRRFLIYCAIVSFLIIALALLENILKTNIWLDFVYYNSPFDPNSHRMFYSPGHLEMRYGLVRSRSFFGYHIPFGFACLCLFWVIYYFSRYSDGFINNKIFAICAMSLVAGVIMSNSKQVYMGLIIMIFCFYSAKQVFQPKIVFPILIGLTIIGYYFPDYLNNFLSLTDEELAEEGGGSTIASRQSQYEIGWKMFLQNPIIGNGVGSLSVLRQEENYEGILGAESVWLQILPERGLVGAYAYLYLYKSIWNHAKFQLDKKILFFLLLSIFVVDNGGGFKDISIWGTCLVAVCRYIELKEIECDESYEHA